MKAWSVAYKYRGQSTTAGPFQTAEAAERFTIALARSSKRYYAITIKTEHIESNGRADHAPTAAQADSGEADAAEEDLCAAEGHICGLANMVKSSPGDTAGEAITRLTDALFQHFGLVQPGLRRRMSALMYRRIAIGIRAGEIPLNVFTRAFHSACYDLRQGTTSPGETFVREIGQKAGPLPETGMRG